MRHHRNFKARVSELRADGRTFETRSRWFATHREAAAAEPTPAKRR